MGKLVAVALASLAAASGGWHPLPAAPIAPDGYLTSAWTGKELVVFGRARVDGKQANVAAAYSPARNTWRRLAPPTGPDGSYEGGYSAVWTGREVLVWGAFDYEAYNPRTDRWRLLPRRPGIGHAGGLVVWTGREMLGWGGGCCGDAFSDGVAYSPATNRWRNLARSPLAGSQHPIGAWTGRELVVVVGGLDPDGKPWPRRLARAAAYDPSRNTWRRIAPLPAERTGATAVWDGHEVLVVGGESAGGFAYDPARNHWRPLPPMPSPRTGAAAVWTGTRLLVWGGTHGERRGRPVFALDGLAYAPAARRWSVLPRAPLGGRRAPAAAWTGHALIVWSGDSATAAGLRGDGASYTP